ncbi:protein of unknown function [Actinacidiphila yanglinensis]|uniref:DUF1876 domain-containing protein n=1 Tax=Actinacidiphila yanglinensis TaxID=310779 RepID=A0A1H6D800_9ACTN|nr:dsRBD fold-containing protein [Actinacidiphila yanglinensis]SEG81208.1 protein of unknown function [Actinacidiphila yanglinensis]
MTQEKAAAEGRTRTWTLQMDIVEEDQDATEVRATLDTGDRKLVSRTTAHRNPHDPPAPEIGDEYAAGRALLDLGKRLLGAGATDAAENAQRELR